MSKQIGEQQDMETNNMNWLNLLNQAHPIYPMMAKSAGYDVRRITGMLVNKAIPNIEIIRQMYTKVYGELTPLYFGPGGWVPEIDESGTDFFWQQTSEGILADSSITGAISFIQTWGYSQCKANGQQFHRPKNLVTGAELPIGAKVIGAPTTNDQARWLESIALACGANVELPVNGSNTVDTDSQFLRAGKKLKDRDSVEVVVEAINDKPLPKDKKLRAKAIRETLEYLGIRFDVNGKRDIYFLVALVKWANLSNASLVLPSNYAAFLVAALEKSQTGNIFIAHNNAWFDYEVRREDLWLALQLISGAKDEVIKGRRQMKVKGTFEKYIVEFEDFHIIADKYGVHDKRDRRVQSMLLKIQHNVTQQHDWVYLNSYGSTMFSLINFAHTIPNRQFYGGTWYSKSFQHTINWDSSEESGAVVKGDRYHYTKDVNSQYLWNGVLPIGVCGNQVERLNTGNRLVHLSTAKHVEYTKDIVLRFGVIPKHAGSCPSFNSQFAFRKLSLVGVEGLETVARQVYGDDWLKGLRSVYKDSTTPDAEFLAFVVENGCILGSTKVSKVTKRVTMYMAQHGKPLGVDAMDSAVIRLDQKEVSPITAKRAALLPGVVNIAGMAYTLEWDTDGIEVEQRYHYEYEAADVKMVVELEAEHVSTDNPIALLKGQEYDLVLFPANSELEGEGIKVLSPMADDLVVDVRNRLGKQLPEDGVYTVLLDIDSKAGVYKVCTNGDVVDMAILKKSIGQMYNLGKKEKKRIAIVVPPYSVNLTKENFYNTVANMPNCKFFDNDKSITRLAKAEVGDILFSFTGPMYTDGVVNGMDFTGQTGYYYGQSCKGVYVEEGMTIAKFGYKSDTGETVYNDFALPVDGVLQRLTWQKGGYGQMVVDAYYVVVHGTQRDQKLRENIKALLTRPILGDGYIYNGLNKDLNLPAGLQLILPVDTMKSSDTLMGIIPQVALTARENGTNWIEKINLEVFGINNKHQLIYDDLAAAYGVYDDMLKWFVNEFAQTIWTHDVDVADGIVSCLQEEKELELKQQALVKANLLNFFANKPKAAHKSELVRLLDESLDQLPKDSVSQDLYSNLLKELDKTHPADVNVKDIVDSLCSNMTAWVRSTAKEVGFNHPLSNKIDIKVYVIPGSTVNVNGKQLDTSVVNVFYDVNGECHMWQRAVGYIGNSKGAHVYQPTKIEMCSVAQSCGTTAMMLTAAQMIDSGVQGVLEPNHDLAEALIVPYMDAKFTGWAHIRQMAYQEFETDLEKLYVYSDESSLSESFIKVAEEKGLFAKAKESDCSFGEFVEAFGSYMIIVNDVRLHLDTLGQFDMVAADKESLNGLVLNLFRMILNGKHDEAVMCTKRIKGAVQKLAASTKVFKKCLQGRDSATAKAIATFGVPTDTIYVIHSNHPQSFYRYLSRVAGKVGITSLDGSIVAMSRPPLEMPTYLKVKVISPFSAMAWVCNEFQPAISPLASYVSGGDHDGDPYVFTPIEAKWNVPLLTKEYVLNMIAVRTGKHALSPNQESYIKDHYEPKAINAKFLMNPSFIQSKHFGVMTDLAKMMADGIEVQSVFVGVTHGLSLTVATTENIYRTCRELVYSDVAFTYGNWFSSELAVVMKEVYEAILGGYSPANYQVAKRLMTVMNSGVVSPEVADGLKNLVEEAAMNSSKTNEFTSAAISYYAGTKYIEYSVPDDKGEKCREAIELAMFISNSNLNNLPDTQEIKVFYCLAASLTKIIGRAKFGFFANSKDALAHFHAFQNYLNWKPELRAKMAEKSIAVKALELFGEKCYPYAFNPIVTMDESEDADGYDDESSVTYY